MRNITSTYSYLYTDPSCSTNPQSRITRTAVNPENDDLYVLKETLPIGAESENGVELEVLKAVEQGGKRSLQLISLLLVPINNHYPTSSDQSQCLTLRYLAEERALCAITSGGDIALFKVGGGADGYGEEEEGDGDFVQGYTVGSIDSGIKAAEWSPDDEQLVIVTGDDQLVVMSRDFDVVHEAPLRTEDFGEDQQINVGWGSKQTQFHGSLGKQAAQASTPKLPLSSPSDHGLPQISWRGDGTYFCISSLDPYSASSSKHGSSRRQVRVYSRSPIALSATSEPIYGLEAPISWRPAGNLIATIQGFGWEGGAEGEGEDRARRDVIFLERNGLQHGDFRLREYERYKGKERAVAEGREGSRVRGLSYASDSGCLAVWIERKDGDVVQLWTMNNYHYYLKQELFPTKQEGEPARFTSMAWHTEKPLTLYLTGKDSVIQREFALETVAARLPIPRDTGSVAVVDGQNLLMTPFRSQNVPPPMSAYQISLPSVPVHIAFSHTEDQLVTLYANGAHQIWDLNTRIPIAGKRGGGAIAKPEVVRSGQLAGEAVEWRQVVITKYGKVAGLGRLQSDGDVIAEEDGSVQHMKTSVGRLIINAAGEAVSIDSDGKIVSKANSSDMTSLRSACFDIVAAPQAGLLFALEPAGKLWAVASNDSECPAEPNGEAEPNGDDGVNSSYGGSAANFEPYLVANNATSITVSSSYLIFTTTSHGSKYAPLDTVRQLATDVQVPEADKIWESRRVERGSRIVTVVPSGMTLVLQMPRGNLESINPRPLVLEVVQREVANGRYRSAFLHCRRHRIDLNILYDLDPVAFEANIQSFVDQVAEVDYLNLFVSGLSADDVTKTLYPGVKSKKADGRRTEKSINAICDSIRRELEQKDLVRYVDTVLTTHVCKSPPDLEAGLRVLLQLKATNPTVVEDAIKYIIFLTDVNRLFDVALGMYDFQLVLMVAQYSQKDPKEYLPFLRELKALDRHYQRFKIDDHLERWPKALTHLHAGDRFDEATAYIEKHDLYIDALQLYKNDDDRLKVIYGLYGSYLVGRRDYLDGATAFILAGQPAQAMQAYEQAHEWRQLFTLALQEKVEEDQIADMCERVSEYLARHARHIEAAQILLDYGKQVDEAVHILCRGAQFAEASRLIALHNKPDLIGSTVYPGLEDAHEQFIDTFDEMEGQLDKEMERAKELRKKVDDDPETFFMIDTEPALENVDVMTQATTAVTGFTRFTVAKSARTGTSRDTSSTRRRSRKRAAGKKHTIDEFLYLLSSLGRLVTRIEEKCDEVTPVLPAFITASPDHRILGKELQDRVESFRQKISASLDLAWEYKADIDKIKYELIDKEEATRQAWLVAQRQAQGDGEGAVAAEGTVEDPLAAIAKPNMKAWGGKSRFL